MSAPLATIDDFLKLGQRPRVIAHRGFSGAAPENTMAAFARAIEIGADMIELDVMLSKDGEVVVIHDETLDRTTDGKGPVAALALEKLRRLDAGSWFAREFAGERIPALDEVLALVHGKILLNIEIKSEAVTETIAGGVVEKSIALVRERGMLPEVILSSFNPLALRQAKEIEPGLKLAALYNAELQGGMEPGHIIRDLGVDGFNVSDSEIAPEVVREAHALGASVAVYTVNEPDEMRRVLALGADALFTNHPDRMLELIQG